MTDSACLYVACEKTAFRGGIDLSEEPKLTVILTWYCEHPFHGMRLELGDARSDVEEHCAACSLSLHQPDGDANRRAG